MLTDWNDDDVGDDNEDVADRWDKNGYRIDKVRDAKEEKDTPHWMKVAREQTRVKLAGMKKAIMEKNNEE